MSKAGAPAGSALEGALALHIRAAGLPTPEREMRFADGRKWRFDFAWPERMLAVEVEGGTWVNGRHSRGNGYADDCRKRNAAQRLGWRVFSFTSDMVKSGEALAFMETVFEETHP